MDWNGWIASTAGSWSATLYWLEAHPGTATWLEAVGSIAAIVFVYLLVLSQGRRANSHQNTDRVRRAQGLALLLIPVLIAFKPKLEAALVRESKLPPPDEVMHLLDQLYILGVAGGLILQMVATLQAHQRAEPAPMENEGARSAYNAMAKQRLDSALRYCEDAIDALMKLARARTV
jgi:undecaprenyl pyrophosphate phosphatase UppP